MPKAHAACALICLIGAIICCMNWPNPAPQHGWVLVPAILIWGGAALFLFLSVAGHLRTAILDGQRLFTTSRYERHADLGWIIANVVVLIVVGIFYAQGSQSIPILAQQTATLVTLLAACTVSLVVWAIRWTMSPHQPDRSV
ncbi:hypothetical protein GC197_16965 [bacterium]|nr:hypothetical protein [bacterium]